ncbi:hypothetical protein KI688_006536 [Linnemannia hyalina]|uniref:Galactose oxidase n=1 Tax=Linnemannia hyalina TaxID=64524 RepID=A0A9P7XLP1_9FUNG|nr:hypothetical protein KI688_006536 [Linnemannia hyalina]
MVANRTMSRSRRLTFATSTTTAAALVLLISCSSVSAQSVTPIPFQDMAWTRAGRDLFIHGGAVTLNGVTQFLSPQTFALDLSTSWPVSAAPWRALSNGTASRSLYAVSSANNNTVFTFKYDEPSSYTVTEYDVVMDIWKTPRVLTDNPDVFASGLKPVLNPISGLVYIPGNTSMNEYQPEGPTFWRTQALIPNNTLTARYFGSALFNRARTTVMYVGGYNYGVSPTHFDPQVFVTEYSPIKPGWSLLRTTGSPPAPSSNHCSAISDDSKTIVVFGGQTSVVTPAFTGAINILTIDTDTDTSTWTAGPSHTTPRVYAACALVGDQFVVWGGSSDGTNTVVSAEPIVYDLTLNQWVNNYKAPSYYSSNPTTKPTPTSGSGIGGNQGSGSSSAGAGPIIGGVVGVLAVVGVVIGFLAYSRRQKTRLKELGEQLSQRSLVIDSERLDGGGGGGHINYNDISGGGEITNAPVSYPIPPTNPPNHNNNAIPTHDNHGKLESSPYLQHHPQQYPPAATTTMSSPQTFANNTFNNSNHNSPQTPQPTQPSDPQGGVEMYQLDAAADNYRVAEARGPQVHHSPGRAPQAIDNETDMPGYYHGQESGTRHQNHPQEY